jgi:hypothetical protein
MAIIGEGHFSAMARQGLKELRAAFYPNSNVAAITEYGVYGTKTPGEVAQDRKASPEPDEEKQKGNSLLGERIQQMEGRMDQEQREPSLDR